MASIGPPALGAKGCVERLRRFAQGATAVEGAFKFIEGASLYKTFTTALRASEMHPFWWLAPPPSPRRGDFILRYALSEGIALRSFIVHCAHPA